MCVCSEGPERLKHETRNLHGVCQRKRSRCSKPRARSPSGVAASFLRPELEGARLVGPCWCSGDLTMDDIIICCRVEAGLVWLLRSLYCRAVGGRIQNVLSFTRDSFWSHH